MTSQVLRRSALAVALAAVGFLSGAAFGTTHAESALGTVLHVRVQASGNAPDVPSRTVEYWLDEGRGLARSEQSTVGGLVAEATGPDWYLHVPARGALIRYEAPLGTGITTSVAAQLFFMRDALRAGAARITSEDATTVVVELSDRRAALTRSTGLPLWESIGAKRVDYSYLLQETLPATQFPESFFSAAPQRDVVSTIETTPAEAARRVHFPLLYGGSTLVGRALDKTVVSLNLSSLTTEQVAFLYGDLAVTMGLLAEDPASLRPGGRSVPTSRGPGVVFDEPGRSQVLVLNGRIALSVFGPTEQQARAALEALRAAP